jgi:uncharacterized protein YdhG (YjbR/CyaY superfamily)
MKNFESINSYIDSCPEAQQEILREMRRIISNAAPEAAETINYGMPTYKLHGNLVHFGAAKKHLGFYPGTSAIVEFAAELVEFKTSKGGIQLPLQKNLPVALIEAIVAFRVKEQHKLHQTKSN